MSMVSKLTKKVAFCATATGMLSIAATQSFATQCYHHYNHNAWHGKGMAIVFCLNSGGVSRPGSFSLPMAACEARYHNTGVKIADWRMHDNTDNGRQAFTDYNTTGAEVNAAMDLVCTGKNGRTYTYYFPNSNAWGDPGVCPQGGGYIGGSECDNDHNPILTVTKSGIGKGSIVGDIPGDVRGEDINCSTNCTRDSAHYQFYSNKRVTLTAEPAAGYKFVRWTGDCSGDDKCVVTMSKDTNVTAVFDRGANVAIHKLLLDKKDR